LVESIQKNTKRYIDVFSQAVDAMMPAGTKDISYVALISAMLSESSLLY
jgi:hypothetical protein